MQENGKVMSDPEDNKYHIFYTDVQPEKIPRNRELKISKKLYEFYTAPITKFWANSVRKKFDIKKHNKTFFILDCVFNFFNNIQLHNFGENGRDSIVAGMACYIFFVYIWL